MISVLRDAVQKFKMLVNDLLQDIPFARGHIDKFLIDGLDLKLHE